ncbi:protein SERAC1 [Diorhabda sublineata]|uniref:protein SERAC1 n=1 Tax=Diorhabda sublineata TaxID=1163346 RepID=UPI0024E056A3|nr:protein SERAC1 [Diorhabda sublineata]XP_056642686.1 protein SERAC1 [Diorhabda sublineata]
MEVEDIMCDQSILRPEVNVSFDSKVISTSKLWVVVDVIVRSILPPISTICCTVFRNPQVVLQNVRNQIFPAVIAFVVNNVSRSLASVQNISLPVTLRITQDGNGHNRAVITDEGTEDTDSETSEKSVECIVLYEPKEIGVDVIFLHGLHGGITKTWKQGTWRTSKHKLNNQSPIRRQSTGNLYVPPKDHALKRTLSNMCSIVPTKIAKIENNIDNTYLNNEEEESIQSGDYTDCWPRDWIPKDCPNARIIAINYTTDVLWCPTWMKKRKRTNLIARSNEMIEELIKIGVGRKPIMWVGHSKGGLYIKQMLINAYENMEMGEIGNIFKQSKGIMWYSVPHKGSKLADLNLPLLRRSVELLEIQKNCNFILNLHNKFLEIVKKEKPTMDIFSFIETSFTFMSFIYLKIVPYESADAKIGIKCDVPLDHREICKPAGRDCFLYLELIKLIKKYTENNTN